MTSGVHGVKEGWYRPNTRNGYCHCGCGGKTALAVRTNKSNGTIAGQSQRFIQGHSSSRLQVAKEQPSKICVHCNKIFSKPRAGWTIAKWESQLCCSRKCYNDHRCLPRPLCARPGCSNLTNYLTTRYCSRSCMNTVRKDRGICKAEGCDRLIRVHDWCTSHAKTVREFGVPIPPSNYCNRCGTSCFRRDDGLCGHCRLSAKLAAANNRPLGKKGERSGWFHATVQERQDILARSSNENTMLIADSYGVSHPTIRKIILEEGGKLSGIRRPSTYIFATGSQHSNSKLTEHDCTGVLIASKYGFQYTDIGLLFNVSSSVVCRCIQRVDYQPPGMRKRKQTTMCISNGCDRKPASRNMCDKHYRRWKKYGTTEPPLVS